MSGGKKVLSVLLLLFAVSGFAEQSSRQEAESFLGEPLYRPEISAEELAKLEANLEKAKAGLQKNPESADAIIWVGRRTAYLGRYNEAITIFTSGIEKHPNDARLYRHRGHRYITTRRLDHAIADLQKAADLVKNKPDEIEPDGIPNARNIPTSTLNSNIFYHLGLAYYLKGDFTQARRAYEECMRFSKNDDMLSATSHWLYMTLRRLGDTAAADAVLAKINDKMEIIENGDYHQLLLMYKGQRNPGALLEAAKKEELSFATTAYGIGNWYLYNGNKDGAFKLFDQILNSNEWAAFGYIAAEAEVYHREAKLRASSVFLSTSR